MKKTICVHFVRIGLAALIICSTLAVGNTPQICGPEKSATLMFPPLASINIDLQNFGSLGVNEKNSSSYANRNESIIVFTAHQEWPSRIYLLNMDGSVITYYEYWFYRFVDLEIINNEVYVSDAFAPRVYKVDITTGDLELIIDDWLLYYFYDVAFDGTFFYVTEWDLNRYDINGTKDGTAAFDENVMGATWDGAYYWTLNDNAEIKCWNLSLWPVLVEITNNSFSPPSLYCRGLWFDGQYFWTAECIEGILGKIYQFDYQGGIINQWTAPAFMGWSAGVIESMNTPPNTPNVSGPSQGVTMEDMTYTVTTHDTDGDNLFVLLDWGDDTPPVWYGPISSDSPFNVTHSWNEPGVYTVKAKAKDIHNSPSEWSDPIIVEIGTIFNDNLYQNWNLIAIPLKNDWTAETLGENITGATAVIGYLPDQKIFITHVVGTPWDDFSIENGVGYYVFIPNASTYSITGLPIANVNVTIHTDWNLLGWFNDAPIAAESLGASIIGCTQVVKFDAASQVFLTHVVGTPWDNFLIEQGEGLFVYTTQSSIWDGTR